MWLVGVQGAQGIHEDYFSKISQTYMRKLEDRYISGLMS